MKQISLSLIFSFLLLFSGCGECGRNIDLGKFELISQSVDDWYPYKESNGLTFKNSEGQILTLEVEEQHEEMILNQYREICSESTYDNQLEIFWGEFLHTEFRGIYNSINYIISVSLKVAGMSYIDEATGLRLKDLATYSFNIYGDEGYLSGGVYIHVTDYRGNTKPDDTSDNSPYEILNEVDINGKTYYKVWYFDRENASSFYIQPGQGIIAFQGVNDDFWVLQ